ncbi:hypothetical protein QNA23_10860 [Rhodococcus erythropolis]|uniref:hypothetical protein n=1 Tax=Rhodococcus erythropolis TaxID=1833 RepID=UPI0024B99E38|nr:hypothetical protein [Rhodococcus erythropolis]MDJ0403983.1 hypothetical protein [Rhodococcus erythropolis]
MSSTGTADTPERRNKIAAIVNNYLAGSIEGAMIGRPEHVVPNVRARSVLTSYEAIRAALAGETDPVVLGLPKDCTPALQIRYITGQLA